MKKKLVAADLRLQPALDAVRLMASADPFWGERLSGLMSEAAVEFAVHLAVFVEPFLGYILDGSKTIESRFSVNRCAPFGVDHLKPKGTVEYAHLICLYENLVYACNRCNSIKQDELLLDPCSEAFAAHVVGGEDGTIRSLTLKGQDLIDILGLDLRVCSITCLTVAFP